jgi:hypothetical protein
MDASHCHRLKFNLQKQSAPSLATFCWERDNRQSPNLHARRTEYRSDGFTTAHRTARIAKLINPGKRPAECADGSSTYATVEISRLLEAKQKSTLRRPTNRAGEIKKGPRHGPGLSWTRKRGARSDVQYYYYLSSPNVSTKVWLHSTPRSNVALPESAVGSLPNTQERSSIVDLRGNDTLRSAVERGVGRFVIADGVGNNYRLLPLYFLLQLSSLLVGSTRLRAY